MVASLTERQAFGTLVSGHQHRQNLTFREPNKIFLIAAKKLRTTAFKIHFVESNQSLFLNFMFKLHKNCGICTTITKIDQTVTNCISKLDQCRNGQNGKYFAIF